MRAGSLSCKYPNNYIKVREGIYLGEEGVCLWWRIRSLSGVGCPQDFTHN